MVRIDQLTEQAERELLRESLGDDLIARFALYLEQYPEAAVFFRGKRLDGAAVRNRTETFSIKLDGMEHEARNGWLSDNASRSRNGKTMASIRTSVTGRHRLAWLSARRSNLSP
jgi:hypothetical protein